MYPGVHAQSEPNRPAVVMVGSGRTLTYGQLEHDSAAVAAALHARGLRKGDVIALLSDNAPEAFTVFWAAMRSGLYITPVNRNLTAPEVAYIVGDSGAKALFASAVLGDLVTSVLAEVKPEILIGFGGTIDGLESLEEVVASAPEPLAEMPRGSDMMYSSGTTGRPKGVKSRMLPISVDQPGDPITGLLAQAFKVGPQDVYLQPAPIYHAAPLKWAGAIQALGGTVVMLEKFDAETALRAIQEHSVTIAQFVPTMFVRMLQLPEHVRSSYDVSSLRLAVHAAAPCPPEVKQAMLDWWGPVVFEYLGSTEQNGLTLVSPPEWSQKPGTVGKAMIGVVHICDDDGNELPPGEVGTIYFERDELPFEYHNDPDKTAAAQHPQHPTWTAVGDLGYLDEDGYLFLTDRKSFVIISGGVNIYPQEIENVLTMHDKIFDVAVIGVPDADLGQSVKAVVQLKDGIEPSEAIEAEIIDYVRERVARFKTPRSVDFVDELPRTPTGKLVKRELTKRYELQGA